MLIRLQTNQYKLKIKKVLLVAGKWNSARGSQSMNSGYFLLLDKHCPIVVVITDAGSVLELSPNLFPFGLDVIIVHTTLNINKKNLQKHELNVKTVTKQKF